MELIDIFDLLHYLIGLIIVTFLICCIIKAHNYFSKDNNKIIERNTIPNKV